MKKLLILTLVLLTFAGNSYAQKNLNSQQQQLRTSIMNFLRNDGYAPQIDEDGDISFKKEGSAYFVIIGENNESPMFVSLSKLFPYGDGVTKGAILPYVAEINRYKMGKILIRDSYFEIRCELFLTSSSAFTSIFDKMMVVIDEARGELVNKLGI